MSVYIHGHYEYACLSEDMHSYSLDKSLEYITGLGYFMKARSCFGISLEFVSEDLYFYLKLLVLLYADDTVIFGTDETSFQKNLY